MARYMIPPKTFSLTTLPGAFIIIFMFLMLPFFLARELGWKWFDAHLTAIIVSLAVPSLAAALWIARWVEKRQSEEWVVIGGTGITSTMRTRPHPDTKRPLNIEGEHQQRQSLKTRIRGGSRRVIWQDVRAVELRSRRSSRTPGKHYQVCLFTDNDILPIPLNDESLGTRHMVQVDAGGRPLRRNGGQYPGMRIVREIHRHLSHVPWTVKEEFVGRYNSKEKELAFTGIDDPWSGKTISEPDLNHGSRRRMFILVAAFAMFMSMVVSGVIVYQCSREKAERAKMEALRKVKTDKERKATDESAH